MVKVALLLYGQPRILPNTTFLLQTLKKNVQSLFEEPVILDIYAHAWHTPSQQKYDMSDWTSHLDDGLIDSNSISFIKYYYNPISIQIQPPFMFTNQDKEKYFHPKTNLTLPFSPHILSTSKWGNMVSQIKSVERVCNLIHPSKEDEYTFFILTRYDYFFNYIDIPLFQNILKQDPQLNSSIIAYTDLIQIFGKKTLKLYQSNIFEDHLRHQIFPYVDAELLRYHILSYNNIQSYWSYDENKYKNILSNLHNTHIIGGPILRNYHHIFPTFNNIIDTFYNKPMCPVFFSQRQSKLSFLRISKKSFKVYALSILKESIFRWIGGDLVPFKIKFLSNVNIQKFFTKVHFKGEGSSKEGTLPIKFQLFTEQPKIGEWYSFDFSNKYSPSSISNFIYVFLDEYVNEELLEFELSLEL